MNLLPPELELIILRNVKSRFSVRQVCWQWCHAIDTLISDLTIEPPSDGNLDFTFLQNMPNLTTLCWQTAKATSSLPPTLLTSLPASVKELNFDDVALTKANFEALCNSAAASQLEVLGVNVRFVGTQSLSQNLCKLTSLRILRATPDVFALSYTVFSSLMRLESVTIQSNSKSAWDTKITVSGAIIRQCNQLQHGSPQLIVASCMSPASNQLIFGVEGSGNGSSILPGHDCRFIISSRNKFKTQHQKQQIGALLCLSLWIPDNADVLAKARYQSSKEILKRFLPSVEEKTITNMNQLGIEIVV